MSLLAIKTMKNKKTPCLIFQKNKIKKIFPAKKEKKKNPRCKSSSNTSVALRNFPFLK